MSTQDKGNKDCSNSNPDGDLNTAQPVSDDESSGDNTNGSVFNLCSHYRIPQDGFTLRGSSSSTRLGRFSRTRVFSPNSRENRNLQSTGHVMVHHSGSSKDMEKSVPSQRSDSLPGGSSEDDLPLHDAKNHHEDAKNESSLTDRVLLRQKNENSVQENENKLMKATGNCEDNAFNSDQKKNPENVAEQLESGRMANTEVKTRIEIPARENERLPNRLEPVDLLPSSETFYISGGKAEGRLEMRDTQRRGSKVFVIKDKESRVEDSLDRLPANEGSCDEPPRSKVFCADHENTDVTASKSFYSSNLVEMTVTVATNEQDERINERDVVGENDDIGASVNNGNAYPIYGAVIPPKDSIQEHLTDEVTCASETTILPVTEFDNEDKSNGDELNDVNQEDPMGFTESETEATCNSETAISSETEYDNEDESNDNIQDEEDLNDVDQENSMGFTESETEATCASETAISSGTVYEVESNDDLQDGDELHDVDQEDPMGFTESENEVICAGETAILLVTEFDNEDESHDNTQDGDELNDVVGENENIGPSANNGNAGRLYGAGVIPPRGFHANMLGNADSNAGNLDHNIGNIKMENRSAIPVILSDEKGNLLGDEVPIETEPKPPDSLDLDTGPDQHDAEIPTNKDSSDLTDSMEACTVGNDDKTISSDILKIQEKGNEKKDMVPPPLNPNNGSVAQPNIAPAPGIRGYLERYETYFDTPIYKRCPSLHLEQLARIGFKFIKPDPGQAGRIICTDCGKLHSFTDIIRRSPKNFVWHENGCSFENKRFPCDHCENLNVHEQDWEWCNECGQDILPVKAFSELEQHLQMIPEQQAQQNHAFISCLVCNQDVDSRQNVDTCTVCGGPLCICYGYHNH